MGVSGISAIGHQAIVPLNRDVNAQGRQVAAQITQKAASYSKVSNFGTETKLGKGPFPQNNKTIVSIGEHTTAKLMDQAKQVYSTSNFGDETKIGTSKFQQSNRESNQLGERATAHAMQEAAEPIKRIAKEAYQTAQQMKTPVGSNVDFAA